MHGNRDIYTPVLFSPSSPALSVGKFKTGQPFWIIICEHKGERAKATRNTCRPWGT